MSNSTMAEQLQEWAKLLRASMHNIHAVTSGMDEAANDLLGTSLSPEDKELRDQARTYAQENLGGDEVMIDDDANVWESDEGSFWVQGALWVRPE